MSLLLRLFSKFSWYKNIFLFVSYSEVRMLWKKIALLLKSDLEYKKFFLISSLLTASTHLYLSLYFFPIGCFLLFLFIFYGVPKRVLFMEVS